MERLDNLKTQLTDQQFNYTQGGKTLTQEQRKFYEDNGYVVIPGLLKQEDIDAWTNRFYEYCENKIEKQVGMAVVRDITAIKKVKSGEKLSGLQQINKIQDWQDDEVLFTFCKYPTVLPYVQDIVGENVKSVHTMLINKPPNMGTTQRHPLHQDLAYFPFRPPNRIVCAWAAMEDVTRDNGGLVLYPGTHKGQFLEHGYPEWKDGVNRGYWGITNMPPEGTPKVHPTMKAGDVVFFHPHTVHGSGQNRTQGYRKSISCHYAASECQYIDVKGTFHENLAKDVIDFAQKKYNLGKIEYNDIWRRKVRLVAGKEFDEGI